MELSVMILDDEEIILEGLCHFPWQDYGCTVIGKAEDGEKGLVLLEKNKPDIILSDIKMPGMDGLEFAAKAKEKCLEAEIIVLTGYDDFQFAKKAIHIGVSEYLLKPVNFREMHTAVGKVCNKIRSRQKYKKNYTELRQKYQNTLPLVRKKTISDLLYARFNDSEEMSKRMESLSIYIEKYVVIYGAIQTKEKRAKQELELPLFDFVVCNVCEEILKQIGLQVYYEEDNVGYCFVVTFPVKMSIEECEQECIQACEEIQKNLREVLQEEIAFGISQIESNPFHMNHSYMQAMEACEQRAFLGGGAEILTYTDIAGVELPTWKITDGEKKRLFSELMKGNIESGEEILLNVFSHSPDIECMRYNAMELILLCAQYFVKEVTQDQAGKNRSTYITECLKKLYQVHTKQDVMYILQSTIRFLAEKNKDENMSRNERITRQMARYIEQNFQKDLSLASMEEYFKLSKTYINRLLKNYYGKSFLEILFECRMEMAEKLVAEGKYKVYEIAEMVGYHDQSYFIRVFKKKYGVTPNVYKRI